jgi:hypothetical protein
MQHSAEVAFAALVDMSEVALSRTCIPSSTRTRSSSAVGAGELAELAQVEWQSSQRVVKALGNLSRDVVVIDGRLRRRGRRTGDHRSGKPPRPANAAVGCRLV